MAGSTPDPRRPSSPGPSDRFATTDWSLVVAAGSANPAQSAAALESLCQTYWPPLYAYARRRLGRVAEAQDATQAFFARLLEKQLVAAADPARGGFRAFLLTAFKRFLINERARERAVKRGGGQRLLSFDFAGVDSRLPIEPRDDVTPEQLYERTWALELLRQVLDQLRGQYNEAGKLEQFDRLRGFLTGGEAATYAEVADRLQLTEGAVRVAVHRLRQRYRSVLRSEIGRTVADAAAVEDEIAALFAALGTSKRQKNW